MAHNGFLVSDLWHSIGYSKILSEGITECFTGIIVELLYVIVGYVLVCYGRLGISKE